MAFEMESREALWNSQVSDVFSCSGQVDNDDDFSKCTNELLSAHKSVTLLWWNVKSLEQYLKLGIIPRGLRVQIFPARKWIQLLKSFGKRAICNVLKS